MHHISPDICLRTQNHIYLMHTIYHQHLAVAYSNKFSFNFLPCLSHCNVYIFEPHCKKVFRIAKDIEILIMANMRLIGIIIQLLLICSILLQAADTKFISYDALRRGDPTDVARKKSVPPIKVSRNYSGSSRKMGHARMNLADVLALDKDVRKDLP